MRVYIYFNIFSTFKYQKLRKLKKMLKESLNNLKVEFTKKVKEFFKLLDIDGNGSIDLDEWKKCEALIKQSSKNFKFF